MLDRPPLSVVILSYGPAEDLEPCLDSLRDDIASGLAEVIVVDNAYPGFDGTRFSNAHPDARLVQAAENAGFAAGNNIGLRLATGRYLLLLNPDTVVHSGTLKAMLSLIDQDTATGAATCKVTLRSGELDEACHRGFPTPWASLCYFLKLDRIFPRSRVFGRYHLTYEPLDTTHEIDSPSGCFFMVRREILSQVGVLDEDYFMYGEDVDWAYRIKEAGWKILYHPAVSITHLKGMSSGIKGHSAAESESSSQTRLRAHGAFYDSMRIFYRKRLQRRYPALIRAIVYTGIAVKERLTRRRLSV